MIDFNVPVHGDKQRVDDIFYNTDYRANDYCFGNLFIWQKKSSIMIAFHKGFILARYENSGRAIFLYPAGSGDKAEVLRDMAKEAQNRGYPFALASVTPAMQNELENYFPGKFIYASDRSNADYIYKSKDLIGLAGKKFHSKRNHISRFMSSGEWRYEDIYASNLKECTEMNNQWCLENGCGKDSGLKAEYCAVNSALNNFEALGFTGGLLKLYGKVVAFTIGERLCSDTFVIHIEKAFSRVEGAYPTINNEFVTKNCGLYMYVNREEDTGDEGLRKAKLSYHPAILLEKGTAELKDGVTL